MIDKFVALGDIHFPFQNNDAIKHTLTFLDNYKPHWIILLGDVVDCYSLSRFDKDPKRILSLQKEFDLASSFLTELKDRFPKSKIVYLEGNHEKRLQRYLNSHPEISSLRTLTIKDLLGLDFLDIPYVKEFSLGGLLFHHGEVVRKYSGQSARGELEANDGSGVSGHTHRLSHYFKTTPNRELEWVEAGCLCSKDPVYLDHLPDWQNGFVYGDCRKGYAVPHIYKI